MTDLLIDDEDAVDLTNDQRAKLYGAGWIDRDYNAEGNFGEATTWMLTDAARKITSDLNLLTLLVGRDRGPVPAFLQEELESEDFLCLGLYVDRFANKPASSTQEGRALWRLFAYIMEGCGTDPDMAGVPEFVGNNSAADTCAVLYEILGNFGLKVP